MNTPLFLSSRVISTIQRLPESDRMAVATAIARELILGVAAKAGLTPLQNLAFEIIRSYVRHDAAKMAK